MKVAGEVFGVLLELAPGDADAAPPGDVKRAVLGAVCLEGPPGAVRLVAVDLDDESRLGPDEVAFADGGDLVVDEGARQVMLDEEREELGLEVVRVSAAARSSSVRATVVTGIRSTLSTSSSASGAW